MSEESALTIATDALRRLSLIDEMAGMGQRDGDPELTARCRHAARALERMAAAQPAPASTGDGQQDAGHRSQVASLTIVMHQAQAERDKAYRERAALVAYLAAIYPAVIDYREDPEWPVVLIETPSGQLSWHFSREDAHLAGFLPGVTHERKLWDGHTTEVKYERLADLVRTVSTGIYGPRPGKLGGAQ